MTVTISLPALAGVAFVTSARAQEDDADPLDGEMFTEIASTTMNAMRLHIDFLDTQTDYNLAAPYAMVDTKAARTDLRLDDGTILREAGVFHSLGGIGLGWGRPRKGVGVFAGVQLDEMRAGGFPTGRELDGFQAMRRDWLGYAGVGVFGVNLSYGWRRVTSTTGIGDTGGFTLDDRALSELPLELRSSTLVAHYQGGASLGVTMADLLPEGPYDPRDARDQVLAAVRAKLEPKDLLGRAMGKYGLGVDRYRGGMDYYREAEAGELAPECEAADDCTAVWEIDLGGTEIADSGFALHVVPQVAPKLKLRLFDVAFRYDIGSGMAGGRFSLTNRDGRFEPSWDLFAQAFKVWFGNDYKFTSAGLAVSWSYNSPDPTVFLPYEKIHTFGLQLTFGVPGIHPIVAPAARWRSTAFDEIDPDFDHYDTRGEEGPLEVVAPPGPAFPEGMPPNIVPKDPDRPTEPGPPR